MTITIKLLEDFTDEEKTSLKDLLAQRVCESLVIEKHTRTASETGNGRTAWSEIHTRNNPGGERMQSQIAHCCEDEDAELIMLSLDAVPLLMEQVSKLEAENKTLREKLQKVEALIYA